MLSKRSLAVDILTQELSQYQYFVRRVGNNICSLYLQPTPSVYSSLHYHRCPRCPFDQTNSGSFGSLWKHRYRASQIHIVNEGKHSSWIVFRASGTSSDYFHNVPVSFQL